LYAGSPPFFAKVVCIGFSVLMRTTARRLHSFPFFSTKVNTSLLSGLCCDAYSQSALFYFPASLRQGGWRFRCPVDQPFLTLIMLELFPRFAETSLAAYPPCFRRSPAVNSQLIVFFMLDPRRQPCTRNHERCVQISFSLCTNLVSSLFSCLCELTVLIYPFFCIYDIWVFCLCRKKISFFCAPPVTVICSPPLLFSTPCPFCMRFFFFD